MRTRPPLAVPVLALGAMLLTSCSSATAGKSSTRWQQLAKRFATAQTVQFEVSMRTSPHPVFDFTPRPDEWSSLAVYYRDRDGRLVIDGAGSRKSFPQGLIGVRDLREKLDPAATALVPGILDVVFDGFSSCTVQSPSKTLPTDHPRSVQHEWARIDCPKFPPGFAHPLWLKHAMFEDGPGVEEVMFDVGSTSVELGFAEIVFDKRLDDTFDDPVPGGSGVRRPYDLRRHKNPNRRRNLNGKDMPVLPDQ